MFSCILFGGNNEKKTTTKGSLPPHLRPTWSMSRLYIYKGGEAERCAYTVHCTALVCSVLQAKKTVRHTQLGLLYITICEEHGLYAHTTHVKIVIIFYLGFNVEHVSLTFDGGRCLIRLKNLPYYSISVKTQYVIIMSYTDGLFSFGETALEFARLC